MTESALEKARRETYEAISMLHDILCQKPGAHSWTNHLPSASVQERIDRLEAAALGAGKRLGLEAMNEMGHSDSIQGHLEIREALQLMVREHEAAARLAGRLEQAERSIEVCVVDVARPELEEERDRLRREIGERRSQTGERNP